MGFSIGKMASKLVGNKSKVGKTVGKAVASTVASAASKPTKVVNPGLKKQPTVASKAIKVAKKIF